MADKMAIEKEKLEVRLYFKYDPWLYVSDVVLRLFLWVLYLEGLLPKWFCVTLQILVLLGEIGWSLRYRARITNKYHAAISPEYDPKNVKISLEYPLPEGILGFHGPLGIILTYWLLYNWATDHSWYMHILFALGATIGGAVFSVLLLFTTLYKESSGPIINVYRFNEGNLVNSPIDVTRLHPNILDLKAITGKKEETIQLEVVDYNDTQIARLESELKSINHKVDAYLMESVFLGGLAFSGFLTVAAANFLGRETEVFSMFINHVKKFAVICSNEGVTSWFNQISKNFIRNDLYILIMLLCLMSSVFFLLVLTLRLRLNSLSLNTDHLIRILTIFNAKEEELYNMKYERAADIQGQRLVTIGKKIDIALADANKLMKELRPTVAVMTIYRNIAVLLFFLVLIVSGFYFMPMMATIIFVLAAFTQVFRLFETYSKLGRVRNLLKKH